MRWWCRSNFIMIFWWRCDAFYKYKRKGEREQTNKTSNSPLLCTNFNISFNTRRCYINCILYLIVSWLWQWQRKISTIPTFFSSLLELIWFGAKSFFFAYGLSVLSSKNKNCRATTQVEQCVEQMMMMRELQYTWRHSNISNVKTCDKIFLMSFIFLPIFLFLSFLLILHKFCRHNFGQKSENHSL